MSSHNSGRNLERAIGDKYNNLFIHLRHKVKRNEHQIQQGSKNYIHTGHTIGFKLPISNIENENIALIP